MAPMSRMALVLALGATLGLGVAGGWGLARSVPAWPSYAPLFERAAPSVVSVGVEGPADRVGSGFALSAHEVVTARHLVVDAEAITIVDIAGRRRSAVVVGSDARSDLALIRVEGPALEPAPLGASASLRVGDAVVAIGNPFGLGHSLAAGVVGHVGRRLASGDDGPRVEFLQLSVPLNPGNSGGPVFDPRGRVVGVLSGTHAQGQSIAFAVPIEVLVEAVPQLRQGAHVSRAFLGLRAATTADGLVVVSVIPHGPADDAGVRPGDRVLAFAGEAMGSPEALQAGLDRLAGGQTVPLVLERNRASLEVPVELADWAMQPVVAAGMTLVPSPGSGGEVVAVRPRSRAERAGVLAGDRLRAIDGTPLRAPADVKDAVATGAALQLDLVRAGGPVVVQLEEVAASGVGERQP